MSVRDGLLAILTLGPAYGLQLHSEFMGRAPHRKPVNVGQIYGTLERLSKQALIESTGATEDGLPLYSLTVSGRTAAEEWMTMPVTPPFPDWTEMLDQVLVASSVDPARAGTLAKAYRRWWESDLRETRVATAREDSEHGLRLAFLAQEAQGVAALAWLGAVISELSEFGTAHGLSTVRPKRGRRPGATTAHG